MAAKFSATTTGDQVTEQFSAECKGKTVIVTGGNVGLGLETARCLADHGAIVVLCSRSAANGQAAVDKIKLAHPESQVSFLQLDLGSLKSIQQFVNEFGALHQRLDILINNAGIMACPKTLTTDGFEAQFGVNHLGHFQLTTLLMPLLLKSGSQTCPARIVNLSSLLHIMAHPTGIDFDDLEGKSYNPWHRYGNSKLANIIFTNELHHRFNAQHITSVSVHPGVIGDTNLQHSVTAYGMLQMAWSILGQVIRGNRKMLADEGKKTIAQGVSTTLVAALDPNVVHGGYYYDCGFCDGRKVHPLYADAEQGAKLWKVSEDLISQALQKA